MRTFGKVLQRIAIGYCVLVVVVAIVVAIALAQPTVDANFAGVWLILVTLPLSMLMMLLPASGGDIAFFAYAIAAGFIQGGGLWLIGRTIRRSN